jgi:hypothetical protein
MKVRSISELPERWQRRAAAVAFYPLFMVAMHILWVVSLLLNIIHASCHVAWDLWLDSVSEYKEFIVSSHRLVKRTWRQ